MISPIWLESAPLWPLVSLGLPCVFEHEALHLIDMMLIKEYKLIYSEEQLEKRASDIETHCMTLLRN